MKINFVGFLIMVVLVWICTGNVLAQDPSDRYSVQVDRDLKGIKVVWGESFAPGYKSFEANFDSKGEVLKMYLVQEDGSSQTYSIQGQDKFNDAEKWKRFAKTILAAFTQVSIPPTNVVAAPTLFQEPKNLFQTPSTPFQYQSR